MKPGHTRFARLVSATTYSARGLQAAWRFEAAFRQECTVAAVLVPVAFWLGESPVSIALLLAVLGLVLVVELLNSAIEAVTDRIGTEHHELAGRAKDMGSAAVAMSLVIVVTTWALVAWQRFG